MKPFRADSLDALRGITIAMMVLCGSICNWVLPHWMSHCQVPPGIGFDPSIYGITWVDLVFPFFLFAMGAAMPFSVGSRRDRGTRRGTLCIEALWRGLKLAFFAIFLQNMYPWVVMNAFHTDVQTPAVWLMCIGSFLVLFLLFTRWPGNSHALLKFVLPIAGVIIACGMMYWAECSKAGAPAGVDQFSSRIDAILYQSNIIILLLGNMAAVGTIVYICTMGTPLARIAILLFLMPILLSNNVDGSWQQAVYYWSPFPWLYRFEFMKYLFVVIPGTIAGEYLRKWIMGGNVEQVSTESKRAVSTAIVAINSLLIIVVNVTLLYGRHLVANLWISALLATMTIYFAHRLPENRRVLSHMVKAGAFLLMLGLFFESFQGGIRKDDPTFSYYFVTSGLSFYCLAMLVIVCDVYRWKWLTTPFSLAGKNPMIAYAAPQLFLAPLFNLCHVSDPDCVMWGSSPFLGLMRGVVYTVLAIGLAALFSKLRLYWRT